MSEMKLIMERWDNYVNEQFRACPSPVVDVDTFMTGLELAMMDPDTQKEHIEKLKASNQNIARLNKALEVGGLLAAIPAVAASGGVALGAAVVALIGNTIRSRQEARTDTKTHELLVMLCMDEALLDTIDNDIEQAYWANSDIQSKVEEYIAAARANPQPDPMPDFTNHLVTWLNTSSDSPYAAAGTGGSDTEIIEK